MAMTAAQKTDAYRFFAIAFNAAPGATYMSQLFDAYTAGMTTQQIVNVYTTKPEFTATYPVFLSDTDFATKLVNNIVKSAATTAAKAQAVTDIVTALTGTPATATTTAVAPVTRGDVIYTIFNNLASKPVTDTDWGNTAKQMANQVTVSQYYTETLVGNSTTLSVLQGVIANVTNTTDVSTSAAIEAAIGSAGASTGQTYTLTTGVDVVTGTSFNDTIIADNTGTAQLSAADQVNGGAGTDTLKLYNATADAIETRSFGVLSNVENIYMNNGTLTTTKTFTASTLTGVTSLSIDSPAAMLDGTSFTVKTGATQALTLTKVVGTTGAATSTLKLSGAPAVTLNGVGTDLTVDLVSTGTSLAITTTGAASTITLANTGAALSKLTVAGDKTLSLTTTLATLKTIDASGATGVVSVDESGTTLDASFAFTGGSGNDVLTLKAGALGLLTSGAQLNGGAGTGDTLTTNETAALTAAQVAKVNAATGFEVLGFGATASGADVSTLTGISQFAVGAGNLTETFTNAASTSKFTVDTSASNTGTISIANKVGDSATTVTLDAGATTTTAVTLVALTLTGITTVALASSSGAGGSNIITTLTNADNSAITITGNGGVTFTTLATAIGSKVDGAAATGVLTITGNTTAFSAGSSLGDTIIGGSAADVLKASVNNATLTGNGGNDTFNVSVALGGATAITSITDFTKGDKITFGATAGAFAATKIDLSAATTVAAALDLLAAGNNSDLKWGVFGGNTYIVDDVGAGATFGATDTAVKLVGSLDLSTSTFAGTTLTFA